MIITRRFSAAVLFLTLITAAGCSTPAGPETSTGARSTTSPASAGSTAPDAVTIDITISNGQVEPNGKRR
jgi:hypothetical protein